MATVYSSHVTSWESFFVATAGASAALAGLLFVAMSINLKEILEFSSLPGRAGETIAILVNALVIASVGLMPDQSHVALGLEVLALSIGTWVLVMWVQYRNSQHPVEANEHRGSRFLLTQIALLPFVVGGATIVAKAGGGLYWIGAGMVFTFIAAAATAWVLLVEIMR